MFIKPLALAALITAAAIGTTFAGPVKDAETRIASAYADYRMALFVTNQKKQAETDAAIAAFRDKWAALSADWRKTAPPQYADDAALAETLDKVAKLAETAAAEAKTGDLAKSHDTLEGIRDALADLRARNGIVSFSDRMNAYHTVMEHVYDHKYETPAAMAEDVAVLAYLAKDIGGNRPAGANAAEFDPLFKALDGTVANLRAAMKSGDAAAIEAARKAIKPAYSRLFLKFG